MPLEILAIPDWGFRRGARSEFAPFLDYDVKFRRVICSTNAIESLNSRHRKAVKAGCHFPSSQAAAKCLYGDPGTGPQRDRGETLDHQMEARTERPRDNPRRPHASSVDRPNASVAHTIRLTGSDRLNVP